MPLFNDLQSPLSSVLPSPLLPPNKYPNRHADEYSNSDIDYLNNKLNSNTIKALQFSFVNLPLLSVVDTI